MPAIIQLPSHIANLIAAGEVVERPASVVKELLENAVDAGATKVTIEIRDGGMTFLRVTDNGCGMEPEDAKTAFLRHATSKLRRAEDLGAISTMGFRGEALAAIASVSRIDLLTKPAGAMAGTSLHLEAGVITQSGEAGCPDGTTIIIRDLFYNTPARMKFMKSDSVEGSRVTAAVQMQALAHPQVAITLLRDGKNILSTPGDGSLQTAVYCVYGREFAGMAQVESHWDSYRLTGYVTKPTDSRPSRNFQTFFVNDRPVKSKLLISALEEAYRNQLMVGKFPAGVLHLQLPPDAVDVNVHPAKTEVKFLNEKAVFDCVHYGVLAALNKTPDRPQVAVCKANCFRAAIGAAPSGGSAQAEFLPHHDPGGIQNLLRRHAECPPAQAPGSTGGSGENCQGHAGQDGAPQRGGDSGRADSGSAPSCKIPAGGGENRLSAPASGRAGNAQSAGDSGASREAGTAGKRPAEIGYAQRAGLAFGGGAVPHLYSGGAGGERLPH